MRKSRVGKSDVVSRTARIPDSRAGRQGEHFERRPVGTVVDKNLVLASIRDHSLFDICLDKQTVIIDRKCSPSEANSLD